MEAANQSYTPIFVRWSWTEKSVNPIYVSTSVKEYELSDFTVLRQYNKQIEPPIHLKPSMCFETVVRRGPEYYGNYYGSVSPETVQRMKQIAFTSKNIHPPSVTYFENSAVPVILFSFRSHAATRVIDNINEFLSLLKLAFPESVYNIKSLDNSDYYLTSEKQIKEMSTSNVVITNHGAFEGNLIYMRNGEKL